MSSTIKKLQLDEAGDAGLPYQAEAFAYRPDTKIFDDGGPDDSFPLAAGSGGGSVPQARRRSAPSRSSPTSW